VQAVGGVSVGLLPGRDRDDADPRLTVALPTGLGELRNGLVVGAADAVLAVGGSWGTLSEIALALRTGKPVVCLAGWRISAPDGSVPDGGLLHLDTPEEAVATVLALAAR
jgi:uncharacterized protein (TIGR00725 family)